MHNYRRTIFLKIVYNNKINRNSPLDKSNDDNADYAAGNAKKMVKQM